MRSFSDLIDTFGVPEMARILRLPENHIRTMKTRDSIAVEYWPALIDAAPTRKIKGVTFQTLYTIRSRRFAPERAA